MGAANGQAWTYCEGKWIEGNPKLLGPMTHAVWLSSVAFDGARSVRGRAPDLDRHCRRALRSARAMGLAPMVTAGEIEDLSWDGIHRFRRDAELYICPMFYAEEGFAEPAPESTRFVLSIYESPVPAPTGFTAIRSSFRRPARDMAPTDAKASCLYPNIGRAVREAKAQGADTGVVLDPAGNVAEFAYANLFMVKNRRVITPAVNGCFLNGITRQRIVALLRGAGFEVEERAIVFEELHGADELFSTGNYAKVAPCLRLDERAYPIGPVFKEAHRLYWEFAERS